MAEPVPPPRPGNYRRLELQPGQKFAQWTVISLCGSTALRERTWNCQCICGAVRAVRATSLVKGRSKSCGCFRPNRIKHGKTKSREYRTWARMLARVTCKTDAAYHEYGGRGITVCKRWLNFMNFYADMGPRPEGMSLDRIDNNGNYEPGNCRWATRAQQSRNRRDCWRVEVDGEIKLLAEIFYEKPRVIPYSIFKQRVRDGWPIKRAYSEPKIIRRTGT